MVKLAAWHELRQVFKKQNQESTWQQISTDALDGRAELLDGIGWVLSIYKDDDEVRTELSKLQLPGADATVNTLLSVRFDKFHALSLKALSKIVPHMLHGLRYDEACIQAGYHHSQTYAVGKGESRLLPPLYSGRAPDGKMVFNEKLDVPRNPVVLRSINQSRKVLNALVKEFGSPSAVHIELARDLSRPFDERRDIKKDQDAFRDRNELDKAEFASNFKILGKPRGGDFEKWRLYREQQGKCAYSLEAIDCDRLLELGYVEVDHTLPYSRSFDDSKNNKVLVFAKVNRDKGNRTPFEYLDGKNDSQAWRNFVGFTQGNKSWRQAKTSRLLRQDFGKEESEGFRDRNLNDTRYIARFFKNYVEQYLKIEKQADGSQLQRCVVLSGQLTAFLRARWGFLKIREESDRHHALDAVVIAACSHSMVKRLSDYSRHKELAQVKEGFVDLETGEIVNPTLFAQLNAHFPAPWLGFRDEVRDRLTIDNPELLTIAMRSLGSYSEDALGELKPLFVSRAPQRRNSGAAHKETIYAKPRLGQTLLVTEKQKRNNSNTETAKTIRPASADEKRELAIERIGVSDKDQKGKFKFTLERLDDLVDVRRNERMIVSLRRWILSRDEREQQAKQIEAEIGRGKTRREATASEILVLQQLRALPQKPRKEDPDDGPFTGPIIRSVKLNIGKTSGVTVRNGVAVNDTMLRVDVFTKDKKFHLVPVYVHHRSIGLPNRAIVAAKAESEWTLIDESFSFHFCLYPNDLVRVTQKEKELIVGYYSGCDRATGGINLWAHDRHQSVGTAGLMRGIGVKVAQSIEKFDVDVLGNIYPAKPAQRHDLA